MKEEIWFLKCLVLRIMRRQRKYEMQEVGL